MQFDIMRIRLSLIPHNAFHRITRQWRQARFVHICRRIRVLLQRIRAVGDIQQGTFSRPLHAEVAMKPVAQDGWESPFERRSIDP